MASASTGVVDYTDKRLDYERYGIAEYWRFDPSGGEYHDAALAGDRLAEGGYEPIAIETLGEGNLRGYSDALGLYMCWEGGELRLYDPVTEDYLPSHEEERAGRLEAELQAERESAGRREAELRAERESAGRREAELRAERESSDRQEAESRVAELEAELRRLRGE